MKLDPNRVFGDVPESFSHRVAYALRRCEKEETKPMKRKSVAVIALTVLMLALAATAAAAVLSGTVEFFAGFYGEELRNELESGVHIPGGQTTTIDNVTFTLADAVISDHRTVWGAGEDNESPCRTLDSLAFWATGTVSAADPDTNIYLLPWDDPLLPANPESKALKLISLLPNGILDEKGELISTTCGFTLSHQENNTLHFSIEVPPESVIPALDSYQLSIYVAVQDSDAQGNPIESARQSMDWIIPLTPVQNE